MNGFSSLATKNAVVNCFFSFFYTTVVLYYPFSEILFQLALRQEALKMQRELFGTSGGFQTLHVSVMFQV